ncbi:MAG: stage II sporulation protein P [Clostridium sp.]|uniref:stage II sporulation protein P n=1 Tax=Clostridium sp. TaxID=1506 RepID=UPI0030427A1F
MKNKRTIGFGKHFTRSILAIVAITMVISIMISTGAVAQDNEEYKNAEISSFFRKLIGNNVSTFREEKNDDDTKFMGNFTLNPLDIVKREISFLDEGSIKNKETVDKVKDHANIVKNIAINPFELKDTDINKVEKIVEIIGNPTDNSKKKILIYHTHTNEAYAEGNNGLSTTVAAVGDVLTEELQALGFTVVHDKTVHDKADYNRAYEKSRETLSNHLNAYGDFDLIIDMHRDSGPAKENVTATLENQSVAKLMFVTAEEDPRYEAHIKNLNSIIDISNEVYPGLFRGKSIYTYQRGILFYSQDLSDNAVLLEVGANVNELEEAKNSMKYMSKVFAKYLNTK